MVCVRLAAEIFLKIYQKQIEKLLNKQQQATSYNIDNTALTATETGTGARAGGDYGWGRSTSCKICMFHARLILASQLSLMHFSYLL